MKDPERIARDYLAAMEARDLDTARTLVADDVEIVFPGGRRLAGIDGIVANSGGRYRRIAKRFDGCDVIEGDGEAIVYLYGTLYGAWDDGEEFENIRFVDRFAIRDGRITAQWVWNDAGEARLARS